MRFGLVHLAASNICVWAYTSVLETAEEVRISGLNGGVADDTSNDVTLNSSVSVPTQAGALIKG